MGIVHSQHFIENRYSSKLQQIPRISVLQPESALAQTPTRLSPDAIVRWNVLTLDIIKAEKTSGPMAASNLTMVHAEVMQQKRSAWR